jgi:accessory gene regulator B
MRWYPEAISKNLSSIIVAYHPGYRHKQDHIRHGLEWILSGANQFLLVFLLLYPFHLHVEAFICLLSGAMLKMFAGGVHFSGYLKCLIISTLQIVIVTLLGTMFCEVVLVQYLLYGLICPAFIILLLHAPRLYKKKDHFSRNQKQMLKMASLFMFLFLCTFSLFLPSIYQFCILSSVFIQVFSVSKKGEITTLLIDKWLSQYIKK